MHAHDHTTAFTKYNYTYDTISLDKGRTYMYLGFKIDEHVSLWPGGKILASVGEHVLIHKIKENGEIGYKTFDMLYNSCLVKFGGSPLTSISRYSLKR